jgi:hypothetical protein
MIMNYIWFNILKKNFVPIKCFDKFKICNYARFWEMLCQPDINLNPYLILYISMQWTYINQFIYHIIAIIQIYMRIFQDVAAITYSLLQGVLNNSFGQVWLVGKQVHISQATCRFQCMHLSTVKQCLVLSWDKVFKMNMRFTFLVI